MKNKFIFPAVVLCLALVVLVGFVLVRGHVLPKALEAVVIEAGTVLPSASAFMQNAGEQVIFVTNADGIDLHTLGVFPVTVAMDGKTYSSLLKIVDSTPPRAATVDRIVLSGDLLEAAAFVTDIEDATAVSASFAQTPDFTAPGVHEVRIVLCDLGGNEAAVDASLTVVGLSPVRLDAGADRSALNARDFATEHGEVGETADGLRFETPLHQINFNQPGEHEILLRLGDSVGKTALLIVDATPPAAEPVAVEGWVGDVFVPMDFVRGVQDHSEVTARFAEGGAPFPTKTSRQAIGVVLTDASGNSATFETTLLLKTDTEPPVITGSLHKQAFIGDAIAYRSGVSVTDNRDANVRLTVESSAVNAHAAGSYPVYYSAVDLAGNRAAVTGSITIYTVGEDRVFEMADDVLARIITEDMTLEQRARAIFTWVRMNVKYVRAGEKDDVLFGAYRAMTKHSGDCYTFFAISQLLLERAEVPSIPVERLGGRSRHYWQIINVGAGWYHFDTTPQTVYADSFLFTDTQAVKFERTAGRDYYSYDKSLYPEVMP